MQTLLAPRDSLWFKKKKSFSACTISKFLQKVNKIFSQRTALGNKRLMENCSIKSGRKWIDPKWCYTVVLSRITRIQSIYNLRNARRESRSSPHPCESKCHRKKKVWDRFLSNGTFILFRIYSKNLRQLPPLKSALLARNF